MKEKKGKGGREREEGYWYGISLLAGMLPTVLNAER
jgi:hypothetical protein